jgi:putative NADPH-quinone reductase
MAHPWKGSFNWAIYENVLQALESTGGKCTTIDLNKDGFDPVMKETDLSLFSKGQTNDPLVRKYQDLLRESDWLVFIFPIWWFGVPAILKGFFDKVLLKGFAYESGKIGLKGLLRNIKRTTIITTSESPTLFIKFFAGNPIKRVVIRGTLNMVGVRNVAWLNHGRTTSGTSGKREAFLKKVQKHFSVE